MKNARKNNIKKSDYNPRKNNTKHPGCKNFDIEFKDGMIILRPVRISDVDIEQIRLKMNKPGLKEDSVAEAVKRARTKQ